MTNQPETSLDLLEDDILRSNANLTRKERWLRPGIEWDSFAAFLAACMMSIAGLVFINATQLDVLRDILEYPTAKLGNASGTLAFADELLCVPMVSFWGFLSDRVGRRTVMSTGLGFMSLAIWLYPWATTVFPTSYMSFFRSVIFYRLIFAMGGSASTAMITAIIGDYANDTSRAKVAGCTGTATGLGALFAVGVFARLPILFSPGRFSWIPVKRPDIILTFATTSMFILATAVLAIVFMAGPQTQMRSSMPLKQRIVTGVMAIRHPLVALAYASGFVARANSIVLNLFVAPWVNNYMTRIGKCPPRDALNLVRCEPARLLTLNLMSISHLTTLLGAPFFGILAHRMGPVAAVSVPSLLGLLSFGIIYMTENPASPLVYLAMFTSGLAQIGMIITSMALMSSQSSPSQRGALAGVYSLFGALGIIVTSKIGGLMFDQHKETAPFSIVSGANAVLFASVLLALVFNKHMSGSLTL